MSCASSYPQFQTIGANGLVLPAPMDRVGPWIQPYRGKIPGNTPVKRMDALKKKLDLFASLGLPGIFAHGFTLEMTPERYVQIAKECWARGLECGAAWGLDDSDPAGKGERMGRVAALVDNTGRRLCIATLADQEGAYDQGAEDAVKSDALYAAFYATAGRSVVVGDQPWPISAVHSGFPWRSTAINTHFRAPQMYPNNWRSQWGRNRYERFLAWHLRDWAAKEISDRAKGIPVRPRMMTTHAYGWDLDDCVTFLVTYPSNIAWAEWYPEDIFITAIIVRNALAARGFVGPRAVWNFQDKAKLMTDGVTGPNTLRALGVKPYDSSSIAMRVLRSVGTSVGLYRPNLGEERAAA